jgi:hypothetical protein
MDSDPPRPIFELKLPMWCVLEDFEVDNIPRNLGTTLKKLKGTQFSTPVIGEDETEKTA